LLQVGGFDKESPANSEISQILSSAHSGLLASGGLSSAAKLTAVSFRTQVVAGLNYLIKVKIEENGETQYANVKIYRPLPPNQENLQVLSFVPTTLEAPLAPAPRE